MSTVQLNAQYTRLENFLNTLSDVQLHRLSIGEVEVHFSLTQAASVNKRNAISQSIVDCNMIVLELRQSQNEKVAMEYLSSLNLSRDGYMQILKCLDIPTSNRDSISKMSRKIIDGTIGFQLRSQAILEN